MIHLSNGCEVEFSCASGALGFDGHGYWWEWPWRWMGVLDPKQMIVVAKTVTGQPRAGRLRWWHVFNSAFGFSNTCVRLLKGGNAVNAVGLTNPGLRDWIDSYYPAAKKKGYKLAASIFPTSWLDAQWMSGMLNQLDLEYVEVNYSCPNLNPEEQIGESESIFKGMVHCKHPKVIKLSYQQAMNADFLKMIQRLNIFEMCVAINSVDWDLVFPNCTSPIQKYCNVKGGVSGPIIRQFGIDAVKHIKSVIDIPIQACGGICSLQDVMEYKSAGAKAWSFGRAFMTPPHSVPNRVINQYRKLVNLANYGRYVEGLWHCSNCGKYYKPIELKNQRAVEPFLCGNQCCNGILKYKEESGNLAY